MWLGTPFVSGGLMVRLSMDEANAFARHILSFTAVLHSMFDRMYFIHGFMNASRRHIHAFAQRFEELR